jgi:3-deoxy-D-manno-octulosonic-acid transferase
MTLAALRPAALVFSRGDLWPVLVSQTQRLGIPVVVVGGVVRERSRRLAWPTRALLQPMHANLRAVGAVSAEDAGRWRALGVPQQAILVTGDPRHDWALERPTTLGAMRELLAWRGTGSRIVVAGSVEPEDEGPLLEAMTILKNTGEAPRFVLVPHEPGLETVHRLMERLAVLGIPAAAWPGGPVGAGTEAVVVNARGVLADLYLLADVALVGGGCSRGGTHSVVEPAAYGVPVMFGAPAQPRADELALLKAGGGVALPVERAGVMLAAMCRQWLGDGGDQGRAAGLAARRTLGAGAASLSADLVRRAAGLV